jgi:hypothetical protein
MNKMLQTKCWLLAPFLLSMAIGCLDALEQQTKKSPNSIFGKTTQDITEFDPTAKAEVSDGKVRITNPVTGPLEAYGPALEQISQIQIVPALRLFEAENGRFPTSYDEFMEKIVKANNIRLPVLPGGKSYQYDVKEAKLVVISAPAEDAK